MVVVDVFKETASSLIIRFGLPCQERPPPNLKLHILGQNCPPKFQDTNGLGGLWSVSSSEMHCCAFLNVLLT